MLVDLYIFLDCVGKATAAGIERRVVESVLGIRDGIVYNDMSIYKD